MQQNKLVTILIPNYKTVKLTRVCLDLIKKNTNLNQARVIVIDNDSADDSLAYLKTVSWIDLIERPRAEDDKSYTSHSRALDLALEKVDTPYVLSIHTDTLVKNNRWLEYLLGKIGKDPNIAGVGSWKLEVKPFYKRWAKSIEYQCQSFYYRLIGKVDHALEGKDGNFYYLRSHCALYRTDLLRQYQVSFASGEGIAGKEIHRVMQANGHKMVFIQSAELSRYLEHVNHATLILNPELGANKKTVKQGSKRIQKILKKMAIG